MSELDQWLYELDAYRPVIQAQLSTAGRYYGYDCFDEAWQELLCWCWRNDVGRDGFDQVQSMETWLCARIKKLSWQIKADRTRTAARRNIATFSQLESDTGCGALDPTEYGSFVRCPEPNEYGYDLLTPIAREALSLSSRGFGSPEIAEMLGIKQATAKSRVKKARAQYRRRVAAFVLAA